MDHASQNVHMTTLSTVRWGDVPTWALFGTALLALIASGFAAGAAYKQLGVQRRQLESLEADRELRVESERRSQAVLVSAWIDKWRIPDTGPSDVIVAVRNASEEPVWQIGVFVDTHWGPNHETGFERLNVLPPGETVMITVKVNLLRPSGEIPAMLKVAPPLRLQFADVNERTWQRTDHGRLVMFPPDKDVPPMPTDWASPILDELDQRIGS